MPAICQLLIWLALSIFLIFSQTAFQVSEAREGVVIEEIVNHDTWILPLRHGELIPSKPPLFHWLSTTFSLLLGKVNEFTLRLPSLLGGFIILLTSYIFCKKHLENNICYFSLSFLITSYCFIQMSIDGRVDMLFCAFLHCALFKFLDICISNEKASTKDQLILGTYLGLSVLTKGPLGVVLFIVGSFPILLYKFKTSAFNISKIKNHYLNIGILPLVLISLPWYILAYLYGSDGFVSRQLIFENVARFVGNSGIPSKPFWFYFLHLFTQSTISILGLTLLTYHYWLGRNKPERLQYGEAKTLKLLALQAISILIFLSLASGKRRAYLLPLMPHLAIITGILLNNFGTISLKKYLRILYPISKLLLGATLILQICKLFIPVLLPTKNSFLIGLHELPITTSLALLTFAILLLIFITRIHQSLEQQTTNFSAQASLYFTSLYLMIFLLLPGQFFLIKGYSHSYYGFANELKELNSTREKITFIKNKKDESFDTLFFYYQDRIYLHDLSTPSEPGLYISRLEWIDAQSEEFKSKCTTLLNGGRKKDSEKRNLVLFKLNENLLQT